MAPKNDPNEVKIVYVRVFGGEVTMSGIAQKVGPHGLVAKKVAESIASATSDYKGLRVKVRLVIQNRQAVPEVIPSSATLLIRELKEPARDRKKQKNISHDGNLTLDQVFKVARITKGRSSAKTMKSAVKELLGTCLSIGCSVEKMSPKELSSKIASGEIEIPAE